MQTAGTAAMIVAGFCPCSSIPRECTNLRAPFPARFPWSLVVQREPVTPGETARARAARRKHVRERGHVRALAFCGGVEYGHRGTSLYAHARASGESTAEAASRSPAPIQPMAESQSAQWLHWRHSGDTRETLGEEERRAT